MIATRTRLGLLTKHLLLLGLILLLAGATGCSSFKKNSTEGDLMLGVGVDGRLDAMARPLIENIFADVVSTPQPELQWVTMYVGEDSLGLISRWQNIVLLGALEEDDPMSQRVQRMLNDELRQGVLDGTLRVFRQKDVWVRGQTVVVAVAPTVDELMEWLRVNGEVMDDLLTEDRNARMKKSMYARLEQEDLADSLRKEHGWEIRIPNDYNITESSRDADNYIRMRRMYPDRFVTIAWQPGPKDSISADKLIRWRDTLGLTYTDSSRTNPIILDTAWTTLNGVDALKANGIWETYGPIGGGPFVAYLLQKDGTLYLVDGKVFAPDRQKEAFVRHLDVFLNTFEP